MVYPPFNMTKSTHEGRAIMAAFATGTMRAKSRNSPQPARPLPPSRLWPLGGDWPKRLAMPPVTANCKKVLREVFSFWPRYNMSRPIPSTLPNGMFPGFWGASACPPKRVNCGWRPPPTPYSHGPFTWNNRSSDPGKGHANLRWSNGSQFLNFTFNKKPVQSG